MPLEIREAIKGLSGRSSQIWLAWFRGSSREEEAFEMSFDSFQLSSGSSFSFTAHWVSSLVPGPITIKIEIIIQGSSLA